MLYNNLSGDKMNEVRKSFMLGRSKNKDNTWESVVASGKVTDNKENRAAFMAGATKVFVWHEDTNSFS